MRTHVCKLLYEQIKLARSIEVDAKNPYVVQKVTKAKESKAKQTYDCWFQGKEKPKVLGGGNQH